MSDYGGYDPKNVWDKRGPIKRTPWPTHGMGVYDTAAAQGIADDDPHFNKNGQRRGRWTTGGKGECSVHGCDEQSRFLTNGGDSICSFHAKIGMEPDKR